jgi:hypothetical protein
MPCDLGGIVGRTGFQLSGIKLGEVNHADDSAARIAPRIAKGVQLLQLRSPQASLLEQLSPGGGCQRFFHFHKSAGNRPHADEWRMLAPDQQ